MTADSRVRTTNRVLLLALVIAVQCIRPARAAAQRPSVITGETRAVVFKDHIRVYFPLPFERAEAPKKPFAGVYGWMFSIEEKGGFSIVLTADSAMRTTDVSEVVQGSTLRLCAETTPTAIRSCTKPLEGEAKALAYLVQIDINDKALVARVRGERPLNYWRYIYEPGGRYRMDRKPLEYRDRD